MMRMPRGSTCPVRYVKVKLGRTQLASSGLSTQSTAASMQLETWVVGLRRDMKFRAAGFMQVSPDFLAGIFVDGCGWAAETWLRLLRGPG